LLESPLLTRYPSRNNFRYLGLVKLGDDH
jgi:hypothetical protein